MKESTKRKREHLKQLSKIAKMQQKQGDERSVNEIIIDDMYTDDTHQEFNTFKGWLKENKCVKPGEKAFVIWGKPPKKKKKDKKQEAEKEKEKNGKKRKFFPLAHIFSNAQVKPLEHRESA
ncbi:ArdC-like ssDNA-binding domain-containing protein [Altibacter sp. HG106]|uniref:ArdC-like ssDNA-binding domain-containing protein n=1 Tax=Altibacter sp. HG106 TaxID=3023937 RepID=UPI0023505A78|nr:ArdC-like ssDNA-binding domain-containing protein [Altibacter sp. HG106]MDC7994465.1 ArdC-like ssDNA-binding domain-containing protein [Altibacter sp. HG106]